MNRPSPDYDVAIVGAGFAGLAAAKTLHQAGTSVVVLEARNRIGGRAMSHTIPAGVIDLGATWFWPNEPLVQAMLEEFNLKSFPQPDQGDVLYERINGSINRFPAGRFLPTSLRFSDGAQALANAIAASLPNGSIKLGMAITGIDVSPNFVSISSTNTKLTADQVIVAVPPALMLEQIAFDPPLPAQLIAIAERTTVWMGNMVKAVATYNRSFWREQGLAGTAFSEIGPFRELHDLGSEDGQFSALFGFAPASHLAEMENSNTQKEFIRQLQRIYGMDATEPVEVMVVDWSTQEFTTPISRHSDATTSAFGHPIFQATAHDRIYWASTETAETFSGHVEGAIQAGIQTAININNIRGHV